MTMKKMILSVFAVALLFACSSDDDSATNQCDLAIDATFEAKQDFDSATSVNYVQTCTAYKLALQNQIQACGDADGGLQAKIDHLGDCSDPTGNVTGEITVTAGTLNVVFDLLNVEQAGGLIKVSGETSAANNYSIYFEVEENMQGENIFQNFEIVLISTYYPLDPNFNNNVTTNTSGTLTGTFSGVVENNDGGQLNLTNGNFDLSY
jgi:hypothetical protein